MIVKFYVLIENQSDLLQVLHMDVKTPKIN
jgi:hypothetical protein